MQKIKIILSNDKVINLVLDEQYAPKTVENFIKLVKNKFYDGCLFHRVIDNFMIQTGGYFLDGNSLYKKETPSINGEFKQNGFDNQLLHKAGVISMARTSDPNSASSQFFICSVDCPHLDGAYAAFGYTTDEDSLKVVKEVAKVETTTVANYFTDFPVDLISIKTIELVD